MAIDGGDFSGHSPGLLLINIDSLGYFQSKKVYTNYHSLFSISFVNRTRDGGYIYTAQGSKTYHGTSLGMPIVVKFAQNGDFEWAKIIEDSLGAGTVEGSARLASQTNDGGYVLTSNIGISSVIKLTDSGQLAWFKRIHAPHSQGGCSIDGVIEMSDSSLMITGGFKKSTDKTNLFFLSKLNSVGEVQWSKCLVTPEISTSQIIRTADGGFAIASTVSKDSKTYDIRVMRCTADGKLLWSTSFDAFGDEYVQSMTETCDGNIVVCGATFLFSLDSAGTVSWAKGINLDFARFGLFSVAQFSDSTFGLTGTVRDTKTDNLMALFAKTNKTVSNCEWAPINYNTYHGDTLIDFDLVNYDDGDPRTVLASVPVAFEPDTITLEYEQSLCVRYLMRDVSISESNSRAAVFPNPASNQVSYILLPSSIRAGNYILTISNLVGVIVRSEQMTIKEDMHQISFPTSDLPAGTYFISLVSEFDKKVFWREKFVKQ
ncbi:MAG TPA: T9SS type A sorting domain-containing protein [Candidatus Kapabacteria bacterium]|nr:T9SS type A sorting domain-containing protein [Candidatus Kapabacteria bacterium]